MRRAIGIGGVFFRAKDRPALLDWYEKHLGVPVERDWGGAQFRWREDANPAQRRYTVWSTFSEDTKYFAPSDKPYMVNFVVDDLRALLAALRTEGCTVMDQVEESEYGKFGWVLDPEGTNIELWEPPAGDGGEPDA